MCYSPTLEFSSMFRNRILVRLLIAMLAAMAVVVGTSLSGTVFAARHSMHGMSDETPPNQSAPNRLADGAFGAAAANETLRLYLPGLTRSWPLETIFGIETIDLSGNLDVIANTGTTWIRRNTLPWKDIEPTQGARNWSAAASVEADMIAASSKNLKLILTIHGTPSWAQQFNNFTCSPIRTDKIEAFVAFVRDAVARYSKSPYNVKYWEIWNEPDLGRPTSSSPTLVEQPYGCWGDPSDPYYGGGAYAALLQRVTPQIRDVDPNSKVLLGGLLIGCNPDQPPAGDDCRSGRYLEGILRGGGAPYFDAVSFHAYDFFDVPSNTLGRYINNNWASASNTTGPVLIAKARYIKNLLSRYRVTGKLLMNTEVGLLCYACTVSPSQFQNSKAYYVPQAYSAAIAEGLTANVWYLFEGWFLSELNEPAYTAFKTARAKLGGVSYVSPISNSDVGTSGVSGYKFSRDGKAIWVIWSLDGGTKNVTLSGTPAKITDAVGVTISPSAAFQLTVKPLYLEWP